MIFFLRVTGTLQCTTACDMYIVSSCLCVLLRFHNIFCNVWFDFRERVLFYFILYTFSLNHTSIKGQISPLFLWLSLDLMFQNRSCSKNASCTLTGKLNNIGIKDIEWKTRACLFRRIIAITERHITLKNEVSCIAIHFRWGSLFNTMTLLGMKMLNSSDWDLEN